MIYTVSLNPSIDYYMDISKINEKEINRSKGEEIHVGGKGVNVSRVLKILGKESTILGFVAGDTGKIIVDKLKKEGQNVDMIYLKHGNSRINIKTKACQINGAGPEVSDRDIDLLEEKIRNIKDKDILVLSGSAPKGVNSDIYKRLARAANKVNAKIIVDADGELLKNTLDENLFLIKPNIEELLSAFNESDISLDKAKLYARDLINSGVKNILLTLGKDGSILFNDEGVEIFIEPEIGQQVSDVGAGDSFLAGFIYKYLETSNAEESAIFASKVGAAAAFSLGLPSMESVNKVLNK